MYAIRPGDIGIEYIWQRGNATDVATTAFSSGYLDTCGMWYRTANSLESAEGQVCFYYHRKVRIR
jgi:hypothetical protein